jgi:hypothetical protein
MKTNKSVVCFRVLSAILLLTTSPLFAGDVVVPGIFTNRFGQAREGCLLRHRATATDRSVVTALRWFKTHQKPDGSWGEKTSWR